MKIEVEREKLFQPVGVSITFETEEELKAFQNFLGNLGRPSIEKIMGNDSIFSEEQIVYDTTYRLYKKLTQ